MSCIRGRSTIRQELSSIVKMLGPLIGSDICIKCVVDEDDCETFNCGGKLLQALVLKEPLMHLLNSAIQSGSSRERCHLSADKIFLTSLILEMMENLIEEGLSESHIVRLFADVLNSCISYVSRNDTGLCVSIDQLRFFSQETHPVTRKQVFSSDSQNSSPCNSNSSIRNDNIKNITNATNNTNSVIKAAKLNFYSRHFSDSLCEEIHYDSSMNKDINYDNSSEIVEDKDSSEAKPVSDLSIHLFHNPDLSMPTSFNDFKLSDDITEFSSKPKSNLEEEIMNFSRKDLQITDQDEEGLYELGRRLCCGENDEEMMRLCVSVASLQTLHAGEKPGLDMSRVSVCSVVGPGFHRSSVVEGLVLPLSSDQISILHQKHGRHCRALLVNGDVTFTYRHQGYRCSGVTQNIVKGFYQSTDRMSVTTSGEHAWINDAMNILHKFKVDVIFVRGSVSSNFLVRCQAEEIVVFSGVEIEALRALKYSTQSAILQYITDCTQTCVMQNVTVDLWSRDWLDRRIAAADQYVIVNSASNCCQTVVLCDVAPPLLSLRRERFHHCAQRLSAVLKSRRVLKGHGVTECNLALLLDQSADDIESGKDVSQLSGLLYDNGCKGSRDPYLPIVCRYWSTIFRRYYERVQLNRGVNITGKSTEDKNTKLQSFSGSDASKSKASIRTDFYNPLIHNNKSLACDDALQNTASKFSQPDCGTNFCSRPQLSNFELNFSISNDKDKSSRITEQNELEQSNQRTNISIFMNKNSGIGSKSNDSIKWNCYLEEYNDKIAVWRTALKLTTLILNIDAEIVTGKNGIDPNSLIL